MLVLKLLIFSFSDLIGSSYGNGADDVYEAYLKKNKVNHNRQTAVTIDKMKCFDTSEGMCDGL